MGKHERGYERVDKDFYPTPVWVLDALAEHIDFSGLSVWEPACGDGALAEHFIALGANELVASDIESRGYGVLLDFLEPWGSQPLIPSGIRNSLKNLDCIVTNPPYGQRGMLADAFINRGLEYVRDLSVFLAYLLPADYDSAKSRKRYFSDCPEFSAKICLTRRIKWFNQPGKENISPKENHAWYIWKPAQPWRWYGRPSILYAPNVALAA